MHASIQSDALPELVNVGILAMTIPPVDVVVPDWHLRWLVSDAENAALWPITAVAI